MKTSFSPSFNEVLYEEEEDEVELEESKMEKGMEETKIPFTFR